MSRAVEKMSAKRAKSFVSATILAKAAIAHDAAAVSCIVTELNKCQPADQSAWLALHTVADYLDEEALILMLQSKVDINSKSYENDTALITAVQRHRQKAVSLLLKHGAHVNSQNIDGFTALHAACLEPAASDVSVEQSRLGIMRLLLSNRADPNLANHRGITPLTMAIKTHQYALAKIMVVEYKASVNGSCWFGITPLMLAAKCAEPAHGVAMLQLLLSCRADTTAKMDTGHTVLMCTAANMRNGGASPYIPALQLLLRDEYEIDLDAVSTPDYKTALSLCESDPPSRRLIAAAMKRRRQWQRIALLTMSLRATRDTGPFRYSILPLARSIMAFVG